MAKNSVNEWSTTAAANTDVGGTNIAENCPAANINDAIRKVMAQIKTAIGVDLQGYDAGLGSIAGLTTAADKMLYTTALDTYAVADLTAAGRALLDDADATAQRATLEVVLDEDDFASDSATQAPSQQSVAAYLANVSVAVARADTTSSGVMSNSYGFASVTAAGVGTGTYRYEYVFTTARANTKYDINVSQSADLNRSYSIIAKSAAGFTVALYTAANNNPHDRIQGNHYVNVTERGITP